MGLSTSGKLSRILALFLFLMTLLENSSIVVEIYFYHLQQFQTLVNILLILAI